MKSFQKTTVFWVAIALTIVLAAYLIVSTRQKLDIVTTVNTISFNGEGKVLAKPDIALASFGIVTEAVSSKMAQDENSKKSQTVTDFLKKQGIIDKDIKTTSYNIYPQYKYPQFDRPQIKGYHVNQTLEVKIRNLDQVSQILDGVIGAGVNQVSNLNFQIDEPEKLKSEARAKAVADAKAKARELENQIGVKLGKVVDFSENTGGFPGPIFYERSLPAGAGGDKGPSIPAGENEITVNIVLTYQIK